MKMEFSNEAVEDLADILAYTILEYGNIQAEKYTNAFKDAFNLIQEFPQIGHSRPDLEQDFKSYKSGQHLIIYFIGLETIFVVRILHQRMDISEWINN
ncbi:MAG: type II toxin-antitoxin system RelE/ParE family toxin [Saprospiraceae bacterium]